MLEIDYRVIVTEGPVNRKFLRSYDGIFRAVIHKENTDPSFYEGFQEGTVRMAFEESGNVPLREIFHKGRKVYPV